MCFIVDLVIFAKFLTRAEKIHEFKNLAKISIIIALVMKNENSPILKLEIRKDLNMRKLPDLQYWCICVLVSLGGLILETTELKRSYSSNKCEKWVSSSC